MPRPLADAPRIIILSSASKKPNWQLPEGVSRGTWDYICSEHIATEYDNYFADSPLMRLDIEVVRRHLPPMLSAESPPQIADLGCGTARVARALLPLGYRPMALTLLVDPANDWVFQAFFVFESEWFLGVWRMLLADNYGQGV